MALGSDANATGDRATAVGARATATGDGAVALGADSRATHNNSAAIGSDARTTRANQMALGTGSNTYTAPGITSTRSWAAQSGPLEVVTTDRAGNLASDGGEIFARLGAHDRRLDKAYEGTAIAVALQTPIVRSTCVRRQRRDFEGEKALALTGAVRLNPNFQLEGDVGFGISQSTVAGRAGGTFFW